jgi:TetR/AcrR family transcriptional regulator, regulator of biofilm formation and stress response
MPAGYPDPDRRTRIAQAGVEIVARNGTERLTHRAVAAAAGVPLGSTTYHYKTLDDLLAAALAEAKKAAQSRLEAWVAGLGSQPDLPASLTRYLLQITDTDRDRVIIGHELYLAALRRPALRPLSIEWDEALPTALLAYTDALTARALAIAVDGLALKSITHGVVLTAEEVEPLLRRIMR